MVPALLAALAAVAFTQDTITFRDAATAELYARARVRHIAQDSLVRDYRAVVRTRMDATAGRSRFARQTPLFAHEAVAEITWSAPNDLQVAVLGARTRAPIVRLARALGADVESDLEEELRDEAVMDRPWFIPRALGDSIRIMGVPEHAALHPLADGGEDCYTFAVTDSVSVIVPGRTVRAKLVHVEPKRFGPSLIAGDMWIDDESGDVVRLRAIFLGDFVWDTPEDDTPEDSARARKDSRDVGRYVKVEADVEYALIERRYWMPYRQFLAITAEAPWLVSLAVPVRAVTEFSEYRINVGAPVRFEIPESALDTLGEAQGRGHVSVRAGPESRDSASERRRERAEHGYARTARWSGGRWEVVVPPLDSLRAHQWGASFDLSLDPAVEQHLRESFAELSALEEHLPAEWMGRRRIGLALDRAADLLRFDRVQGLSVGSTVKVSPGLTFTSLLVTGRFGLADMRPTATVTWRRDGPVGRFDLTAFREVAEAEPWTSGRSIGGSLNALFTAHDDADYYLATGGGIAYTWNYGPLRDLELSLGVEQHGSLDAEATSVVADAWGSGVFSPNPPVTEGVFGLAGAREHYRLGPVRVEHGVQALGSDSLFSVRGWTATRVGFSVLGRTGALGLVVGGSLGDSIPQMDFRLGGPETVRGYPYGTRRAPAFWSARLDLALTRPRVIVPVVFGDLGDTFEADPLVSAGGGLSFLGGLMRFNLAKGLHPSADWRFDLLFRALR